MRAAAGAARGPARAGVRRRLPRAAGQRPVLRPRHRGRRHPSGADRGDGRGQPVPRARHPGEPRGRGTGGVVLRRRGRAGRAARAGQRRWSRTSWPSCGRRRGRSPRSATPGEPSATPTSTCSARLTPQAPRRRTAVKPSAQPADGSAVTLTATADLVGGPAREPATGPAGTASRSSTRAWLLRWPGGASCSPTTAAAETAGS